MSIEGFKRKAEVRKQVPESDPEYRTKKEHETKDFRDDIFGKVAVNDFEAKSRNIEELLKKKESLISGLEEIKSQESTESQDIVNLENLLKRTEDLIDQIRLERNESVKNFFSKFIKDTHNLFVQPGLDEQKKFVANELVAMTRNPDAQEELKSWFESGALFRDLYEKIVLGDVSCEALYHMLREHVDLMQQRESILDELVFRTKSEFKSSVAEAVSAGKLPQSALKNLSRIDLAQVRLLDHLSDLRSIKVGEIDDLGRITVRSEQMQKELISRMRKTLFHEFLHELSGKSITIKTEGDSSDVSLRKSGVRLHNPGSWDSRNEWLNEAITEKLALQLSEYQADMSDSAYLGSHSYTEERKELNRLLDAGLDEQVVYGAYFENFSADDTRTEKGANFRKLVQSVNTVEGAAGFNHLDNKYLMHTIKQMLQGIYLQPAQAVERNMGALPPRSKIFSVQVSIGTNENTLIKETFSYIAQPYNQNNHEISTEEQWDDIRHTLTDLERRYRGRVKFSF